MDEIKRITAIMARARLNLAVHEVEAKLEARERAFDAGEELFWWQNELPGAKPSMLEVPTREEISTELLQWYTDLGLDPADPLTVREVEEKAENEFEKNKAAVQRFVKGPPKARMKRTVEKLTIQGAYGVYEKLR